MKRDPLQNLIPINTRPREEQLAIASKGGKNSGTKKMSDSQKIAWLKRKGNGDEHAKNLLQMLSDPEMSALDMREYLDKIKKNLDEGLAPNHQTKIQLMGKYIEWHKATHGTREYQKVEHSGMMPVNIQINVSDRARDLHEESRPK